MYLLRSLIVIQTGSVGGQERLREMTRKKLMKMAKKEVRDGDEKRQVRASPPREPHIN
jgi:hypothetical protein